MGRVRPFDGGLPGLALNTKGLRENNRHSAGLKKKIRRLGAFKVGFDGIWITRNGDFSIKLGIFKLGIFWSHQWLPAKKPRKERAYFRKNQLISCLGISVICQDLCGICIGRNMCYTAILEPLMYLSLSEPGWSESTLPRTMPMPCCPSSRKTAGRMWTFAEESSH